MRTVSSLDEIERNFFTLKSYLSSADQSNRDFSRNLIRDGVCFVVQMIENEEFFAPSRFVG